MPKSSKKTVEQIYQKKTQLEHILLRPDTYVGSIEKDKQRIWVLSEGTDEVKMEEKEISFVPALYKIFDEILVNAADNRQRDGEMREIRVDVDVERGSISVKNDGRGIPIKMHKEHNVYVPELIFGHLLTSSNYNDKEKKTTGGRNGFGAKLANIFSTKFTVETVGDFQKYRQTWRNNMSTKSEPKIDGTDSDDYTKITFFPDFNRFQITGLDSDFVALMKKRVYDIAGCTPKDLKVYFNGVRVEVKTFVDYAKLYIGKDKKSGTDYFHTQVNDRWEVLFALNPESDYKQVTLVNSIWTIKGGTHEKYITEQMTNYCKDNYKTRLKAEKELLKPKIIKDHLFVFINCLIENPAFGSQTKESLTLQRAKFGSNCVLPPDYLKKIHNKIKATLKELLQFKLEKQGAKSDGKKKSKLRLDESIDDAHDAGTKRSHDCTLILTEGLSAKTLAVAGVSVLPGGKNKYGIMPLRGKMLNVRDENVAKVNANAEIKNIKQLLGLQTKTDYSLDANFKKLRYGKVMVMTDQDHDGSHIKGLFVNFLHSGWTSLIRSRPGFVTQFITPIVVATKGKGRNQQKKAFYTIPEFEAWQERNSGGKGWSTKYFKGLGSWTQIEGKEHFKHEKKHVVDFEYTGDDDDEAIVKAFDKKQTDNRKVWLQGHRPGTYLDFDRVNQSTRRKAVTYHDFIDRDLILFSVEDCRRSIPCLVDGLKPGQRKVLYCCFLKSDLKKEIRVAQLGGYVSEKSAYHHGEASLYQTIISMAQDFVGANNLNLLEPVGMFGSRLKGGKDAASARYIHTKLSPITRSLFMKDDDSVLKFLDDDGFPVEPEWYIPVIPMALVNGSEGIGTGWSTSIPMYNPRDLICCIRQKLLGEEWGELHPWFRGWTGTLQNETNGMKGDRWEAVSYKHAGRCELLQKDSDGKAMVRVTELPVGLWTENYKKYLMGLEETEQIDEFRDMSTDVDVQFTITFDLKKTGKKQKKSSSGNSSDAENVNPKTKKKKRGGKGVKEITPKKTKKVIHFTNSLGPQFQKDMRLVSSMTTSNMVLFDANGTIRRYSCVQQIMDEFYNLRLEMYRKRKRAMVGRIEHALLKLTNQARFITMIINDEFKVSKRKKLQLITDLVKHKFDQWNIAQSKNSFEARQTFDKQAGNDSDDEESKSGKQEEDSDSEGDIEMQSAASSGTLMVTQHNVNRLEKGYKYLLDMPIYSLTLEKVEKLLAEQGKKQQELDVLNRKSGKDLWRIDLDLLEIALDKFDNDYTSSIAEMRRTSKSGAKPTKGKGKSKGRGKKSKMFSASSSSATIDRPIEQTTVLKPYTRPAFTKPGEDILFKATKGSKPTSTTSTNSLNKFGFTKSVTPTGDTTLASKATSVDTTTSNATTSNPFTKSKQRPTAGAPKRTLVKSTIIEEDSDSSSPDVSFASKVAKRIATPEKLKQASMSKSSSVASSSVSMPAAADAPPKRASNNNRKRKFNQVSDSESEFQYSNGGDSDDDFGMSVTKSMRKKLTIRSDSSASVSPVDFKPKPKPAANPPPAKKRRILGNSQVTNKPTSMSTSAYMPSSDDDADKAYSADSESEDEPLITKPAPPTTGRRLRKKVNYDEGTDSENDGSDGAFDIDEESDESEEAYSPSD